MIKIQENISLSKYTSFKIGGPAKYFCVAKNTSEIREALEFVKKNKLKVFILGGGSNLLVSDKGFDGIVIRITNYELRITNNEISVGSGLSLAKLVNESVKYNLAGLEWAAGIPGTVGGAIVNNAGANRKCMGDVMEEIEVLEINRWLHSPDRAVESIAQKGSTLTHSKPFSRGELSQWNQCIFTNKQCNFSYRDSIFKEEKKYIILNAVLKLKKGNQDESRKIIAKILKLRKEKQPLEYPSAGSVFKNPTIDDSQLAKLKKEFPELNKIVKNNTISTGWLIEQIEGLKGKKIGGAMISEKHCNFIVNTGNAKAEDVVILISLIKQKIRSHFGIQLKEEVEYVGF
ncbi:MAG: UDP-N-acetylmuramate dehydrogenase [Patescibacteria group bacterium]|nr:UDP-N-acetylmuramate dehydrogenase [Patescibacteria group bacterium]